METEGGGDRGGWRPPAVSKQPRESRSVGQSQAVLKDSHLAVLNEYFIISFLHDLTSQHFNVSEWSKNHGYFTVTVFRLKTGLGLSELVSAPE